MKKAVIFLVLCILIILTACGRQAQPDTTTEYDMYYTASEEEPTTVVVYNEIVTEPKEATVSEESRYENLAKLAKVWGFAKYTHLSFITGEKCWDTELLQLIPIVYEAHPDDVNVILYEWFVSLGEDGYDLEYGHDFVWADFLAGWVDWMANMPEHEAEAMEMYNDGIWTSSARDDWLNTIKTYYDFFAAIIETGYDYDWLSFLAFAQIEIPEFAATFSTHGDVWRPMADLSWINYDYLGSLAVHLSRFDGIATVDRSSAPATFDGVGNSVFTNQQTHAGMDFSDTSYRLLGLFRLWNAMNYYFPHLDVLDVMWNDLLLEFIPKMLESTDRLSYELTIARMAHYLQDAHIHFERATFFADKFGQYVAPVELIAVEGRLVVYQTSAHANPLERGDIIVGINGRDIEDVVADMRPFLSYPNDEKALAFLAGRVFIGIPAGGYHALRSHTRNMEVDVLRNDVEMTLHVDGFTSSVRFSPRARQSHVLLDNNIGLINPSVDGDVRNIMEDFAETDGMIIDLRQRPIGNFFLEMRQYLMEEPVPFAYIAFPSQTHPGARLDVPINQYIPRSPHAFVYDRPVVLLMDEQTFSHPEWVIMSFRVAPNVTVIGPFSMGSNGNVTSLPLPGGITMFYTGLGVYTPEGEQTHRIGLAPDIHVDRTIQGIAEGRDELMEAAIRHIIQANE